MAAPKRWPAFSLSLILHVGAVFLVLWIDVAFAPLASTQYNVEINPDQTPHDSKIIWYHFRKSLPEINPDRPLGPAKTPHGILDPDQTLITRSPNAPSTRQVIRQPDQPKPLPADVPAPNLVSLAVKLPPKVFVPPTVQKRPPTAAVAAVDAPRPVDAPGIQTANTIGAMVSLQKLPPKPFVAPPASKNGAKPVQVGVSVPTSFDAQANALPGLQAVIVGLDPAAALPPAGSRSAQIAKAPEAGTPSSGATLAPGAPVVPGLLSHAKPSEQVIPETVPAISIPARRVPQEIALPGVNRTVSAPLRPSSRVIPPSVEARFSYRNVYTLVIPSPALPGYGGDWVMWFADHDPPEISSGPRILAPIPARTYSAVNGDTQNPGPPVSATFQFAAFIDKAGHVTSASVLRGPADPELRRRGLEELRTWEFKPALRNGEPMEVDIVVEIPFRFSASGSLPR